MKRKLSGLVFSAAAAAPLLLVNQASALVPNVLTQQGRLLNAQSQPVTSAQQFVFMIYDAASGGNVLWTEIQTVSLDDGYFSARLGDVTSIPSTVMNGQTRYLGVRVGTDAEMVPRQPLSSVPYAFVANNAVGDITPTSISVAGSPIVDSAGHWVGSSSGLIGPAGPVGATGAVGPIGPTGAAGSIGPIGPTGAAGAIGPIGPTGAAGAIGPIGPTGAAGAIGPIGPTGASGAIGPIGPTGPSGAIGPIGPTGPSGAIGPIGPTGPSGAIGPIGPTGPSGAIGPIGPTGPSGVNGAVGATGPAGPAGPQGVNGATGPAGPAGPQGVNGATGPAGPAGANGAVGAIGPIGPAGPQGIQGATGATGPNWTVSKGLTLTSNVLAVRPSDFMAPTTYSTVSGGVLVTASSGVGQTVLSSVMTVPVAGTISAIATSTVYCNLNASNPEATLSHTLSTSSSAAPVTGNYAEGVHYYSPSGSYSYFTETSISMFGVLAGSTTNIYWRAGMIDTADSCGFYLPKMLLTFTPN